MIALALCLALLPAAVEDDEGPLREEVLALREMVGYGDWPRNNGLDEQIARYRDHAKWLRSRQAIFGWQGGRWEYWAWECEQAVKYWRLADDAFGSASLWWEREKLTALLELEGPYWGKFQPPLLPAPVQETMPKVEDANNAAGS